MAVSKGFSPVLAIVLVVFAAVVTLLGFTFYKSLSTQQSADTTTQVVKTQLTTVESTSDLDTVVSDLDSLDTSDSADSTSLDSEEAAF